MDHDRRKWTQFLYGVDWGDPALYDLLINLEHIGIERACGFVVSIIELGGFEFSPERQAAMNDLALASRVRAALAQDPYTLNLALEDEYFIKRKLYPNVDFYSGIIYQAMGFKPDMFTVLFAIPHTVGWLAHWDELIQDAEQKIARPRQVYTGADTRHLPAEKPVVGFANVG
jgi:hypothetical protein